MNADRPAYFPEGKRLEDIAVGKLVGPKEKKSYILKLGLLLVK